MGAVEETYKSMQAEAKTEAEAVFSKKYNSAKLKIRLDKPGDSLDLGLSRMEISTTLPFTFAIALFSAIDSKVCLAEEFFLSEDAFLTDKLEKLGFQLIERGYRERPSYFRADAKLVHALAARHFRIEGLYHGEPHMMQTRNNERGEAALKMERLVKSSVHGNHAVRAIAACVQEDLARYTRQFDQALEAWAGQEEMPRTLDLGGWQ